MNASLERARLLYQQNNYKDAEIVLRDLSPEDAGAEEFALLALCEAKLKNFPAALEHAGKAILLEPENALSHVAMGQIRLWANNPVAAVFAFNEAVRLEPGNADYYFLLSDARALQGSWNYSLTAAQQGLAVDSTHAGCIQNRITAFKELHRFEEARDALNEALVAEPGNAGYREELKNLEGIITQQTAEDADSGDAKEILRVAGGTIWPVLKVLPEILIGVMIGRLRFGALTDALAESYATLDNAISDALSDQNPDASKNRAILIFITACLFAFILVSIGSSITGFLGILFWISRYCRVFRRDLAAFEKNEKLGCPQNHFCS